MCHSQLTTISSVSSPVSLAVTKLATPVGGLALARQVKVVLSAVLRGSKVRVLVNGLERVTEDMVTLASSLDKRVLPLSQVMSIPDISIRVSVDELMEMVQVRVRGATRPAKRGPEGTVMTTSGVETAWEKVSYYYSDDRDIFTLDFKIFRSRRHQCCIKSWRSQRTTTYKTAFVKCPQWVKGQSRSDCCISSGTRYSDSVSIGDTHSPCGPSGSGSIGQTTHCLGYITGQAVDHPSCGSA